MTRCVRLPPRLRLRGNGGFSTIELLLASVLSIVVLGAIYTLSDVVGNRSVANSAVTRTEDTLRTQIDQLVRTVRDAPPANATTTPLVIARAHDFVVASDQTPGAWVRYCVGGPGNAPSGGVSLRIGRMTGTFADPGTGCPGGVSGAWTYETVIASGLLNADALFSYDACPNITVVACTPATVKSIGVLVDVSTSSTGGHVRLNAAVAMRNRS